jgi:hypothetical protein
MKALRIEYLKRALPDVQIIQFSAPWEKADFAEYFDMKLSGLDSPLAKLFCGQQTIKIHDYFISVA